MCRVGCKLYVTGISSNSEKSVDELVLVGHDAIVRRLAFDLVQAEYEVQYQFSMLKPRVGPPIFEDQSLNFKFAVTPMQVELSETRPTPPSRSTGI